MSTTNTTQWRNLFVNGIDGVLIPPGNITTALTAVNDTPALNLLQNTQVTGEDGTNISAIEFGQSARGVTIFAPDSSAFTSDVNSSISQLSQSDPEALKALLKNHVRPSFSAFYWSNLFFSTSMAPRSTAPASNSLSPLAPPTVLLVEIRTRLHLRQSPPSPRRPASLCNSFRILPVPSSSPATELRPRSFGRTS